MSDGRARRIRERVLQASQSFSSMEAVLLTTFGLNAATFEEHMLPAVLGVDAVAGAGRRQSVHEGLGETAVTVAYDPTTVPAISGRYRYTAVPVPLLGRLFHPKIIVVAGTGLEGDRKLWLGVGSANLTLSGWARNTESFGEAWLRHASQQPVGVLGDLLRWLRATTTVEDEATDRLLSALDGLPTGGEPHGVPADMYTSVVHLEGFASFVRAAGRLEELQVLSPYWSDLPSQIASFDARRTTLVPARRQDGSSLGLARAQMVGLPPSAHVRRNTLEDGSRFWHAKAYRLGQVDEHGTTLRRTAVGSCNFTGPGLAGGTGNVEVMLLVPEARAAFPPEDALVVCELEDMDEEPAAEEEAPSPRPVAIVVVWDWRNARWRWWAAWESGVTDVRLTLPGEVEVALTQGDGDHPGALPVAGARFRISFERQTLRETFDGAITEINLDFSARQYGRRLTVADILASWRGRPPATGSEEGGLERSLGVGGVEDETDEDPFAAFDLYDFYRSARQLDRRLVEHANNPAAQRSLLARRPDSVWALARLADESELTPTVRFAVLHELSELAARHSDALAEGMLGDLHARLGAARSAALVALAAEEPDLDAAAVLDWFARWSRDIDERVGMRR